MDVVFDYYSGYEGEGGIRFVRDWAGQSPAAFDLWDGYFDPIMEALLDLWQRRAIPYSSVLAQWNEDTGYNDHGVSQIDDLPLFLDSLARIDLPLIKSSDRAYANRTFAVLTDLISFLQSAVSSGLSVAIIIDEY